MTKIKFVILATLLLILPTVLIGLTSAFAFPGFSSNKDCNYCHNEPVAAYYPPTGGKYGYVNGTFTLDGRLTEPWWSSSGNQAYYHRRTILWLGNEAHNLTEFGITFAQNSTHLFIGLAWEDAYITGTDSPMIGASDGFAMCFNINVTDFQASYFGGMDTPGLGQAVDTVSWKPIGNQTGTQVTANGYVNKTVLGSATDYSFDIYGWHTDVTNNWGVQVLHGNLSSRAMNHYQMEMVRPLVTGDPNDLQFSKSGNYQFAVALFNGSVGDEHYVSYVHELYVYNPAGDVTPPTDIPGFELILTIVPLILIVSVVIVVGLRPKMKSP